MKVKFDNSILDEYKASKDLHEEFCKKIKGLLKDITKGNNVNCHSIDSRVKTESSLELKIEKSDGKYSNLSDITDVSGLRIITYFSDDVDKIASILKEEFEIDVDNSVDKRSKLDPDRFGYLSLHYVVKLNNDRLKFAEYSRFRDLKVEIQIRSILQHAWAEIEHDIGYKSETSIPNVVRRDFSRLAGLLELADEEFLRIRTALEDYNETIKEEIKFTPSNVLIDKVSVTQLLENDYVRSIDLELSKITNSNLKEPGSHRIELYVKKLNYLGFNTIDEVLNAFHVNHDKIMMYVKVWLNGNKYSSLNKGISIFYLAYVLVSSRSETEISQYLKEFNIGNQENVLELAKRIKSMKV